jgi:aspartate kinase
MNGKVVTNDYNLNKVAAINNVGVLNINKLANCLKPVVLPGEEMTVNLVKQGKDPNQAIGYLDDGTMIVPDSETGDDAALRTLTGIAGKKGFCAINIEKDMMNSEIGFGRRVLGVFEDHGISFEHMPSGVDTLTVVVHQSEFMEKEQSVIAGLHRAVHPDTIELEGDLALIAIVGRGMKAKKGTSGLVFSALAHARVNIKMIDQGSSEMNIIIGVRNEDFEAAVKAIYDVFITAQLGRENSVK